jgi:hypothetical protein
VIWRWRYWLLHNVARREVPVSISGRVLENFQVTCPFCRHSAALRSTHSPVPRKRLRGKVRSASVADNSAILVVSNVKVRKEAKHSSLPPRSVNAFVTGKQFHWICQVGLRPRCIALTDCSNGVFGHFLQGRYWILGDYFLGGHSRMCIMTSRRQTETKLLYFLDEFCYVL